MEGGATGACSMPCCWDLPTAPSLCPPPQDAGAPGETLFAFRGHLQLTCAHVMCTDHAGVRGHITKQTPYVCICVVISAPPPSSISPTF